MRHLGGKTGRLVSLLKDAGATAFAVVIDTAASRDSAPDLFGTDDRIYTAALTFVTERFQLLLERVSSHGVVIVDEREKQLDDHLRAFFDQIAASGTAFRPLDRILSPILLTPSNYSLGIQAADLVVGSLHTLTRPDADECVLPERRALAEQLHQALLPCFDRHPRTGELQGVGIKQVPDERQARTSKLFEVNELER